MLLQLDHIRVQSVTLQNVNYRKATR